MESLHGERKACDILFIDFWSQSLVNNILPVYKAIRNKAPHITMRALHTERFATGRRSSPCFQSIGGLECYDIACFEHPHSLRAALEQFRPQVVVTLDQAFLFGRALIKACRALGIRTVFLQRGVISYAARKPCGQLRLQTLVSRLRRYLLHFGPIYFRAAVMEDPAFFLRPSFLRFVLGSLFRNYAYAPPRPTDEARADLALVYGEFYSQKLQELNEYSPDQVFVVGSMDSDDLLPLASSQTQELDRKRWLVERGLDPARPTLTYLAQPLVEDRLVSKQWFDGFLNELVEATTSHRFNLLVKAHPRNSVSVFGCLESKPNVCVEEQHLASSIYYGEIVLGHTSTALCLAVAGRKPVLVWPYAAHSGFEQEVVKRLLEVARPVASRDRLTRALQQLGSSDRQPDDELYDSWLRKYYYFDPARSVRERITEILIAECENK